MLFFSKPSSAFASTSRCRNAPPLPPRPATMSRISQALLTPSKTSSRPKVQRLISWEIVSTPNPPLPSATSGPPPASHPSPSQEDSASWDVIDKGTSAPKPNPSSPPYSSRFSLEFEEISHSDNALNFDPEPTSPSEFDTEAFPPHSHLFPSSPSGTWRNESLHALTHPTAVDYTALCTKLRVLAEEASDEVSARVNRAFQGSDVPAMHDRVLRILPSVSMPDIRDFERAVDARCERGVGVLERRRTRSRGRRW